MFHPIQESFPRREWDCLDFIISLIHTDFHIESANTNSTLEINSFSQRATWKKSFTIEDRDLKLLFLFEFCSIRIISLKKDFNMSSLDLCHFLFPSHRLEIKIFVFQYFKFGQ